MGSFVSKVFLLPMAKGLSAAKWLMLHTGQKYDLGTSPYMMIYKQRLFHNPKVRDTGLSFPYSLEVEGNVVCPSPGWNMKMYMDWNFQISISILAEEFIGETKLSLFQIHTTEWYGEGDENHRRSRTISSPPDFEQAPKTTTVSMAI